MRLIARHKKMIHRTIIVICIVVFVYLVIQTINREEINVDSHVYSGTAMGTAVKKTIYSENVSQSDEVDVIIDDCLWQLEKQISVRIEDSEIAMLNRNYACDGVYRLSENIVSYLKEEMQIYEETQGAFSPCIRPISSLWGIEDGDTIIPDEATIKNTLQYIDGEKMKVEDDGVVFAEEYMSLDLGAIGKGVACDEIKEELEKTDIQGAVVSIGGSILAYGDKGDGKEWHIGIQDPRAEDGEVLGIVDVESNKMISTSGDYEKYFEQDGKRYHHIFDPATGCPADSGLISVSIISDSGLLSDALSTACFVMGLEDGMAYAKKKNVEAIFVTAEKEVYITEGLSKSFRLQADGYKVVEP